MLCYFKGRHYWEGFYFIQDWEWVEIHFEFNYMNNPTFNMYSFTKIQRFSIFEGFMWCYCNLQKQSLQLTVRVDGGAALRWSWMTRKVTLWRGYSSHEIAFFLRCRRVGVRDDSLERLSVKCLMAHTEKSWVISTLRRRLKGGQEMEEVTGRVVGQEIKSSFSVSSCQDCCTHRGGVSILLFFFSPTLPNGSKMCFPEICYYPFEKQCLFIFLPLSFSPCIIFITHVNVMCVRRFPADGTLRAFHA